MPEIIVPQLAVADTGCTLVEWTVERGSWVARDDTVAILETAKASYELAANGDGTIEHYVEHGAWVRFGSAIGRIGPEADAPSTSPSTPPAQKHEPPIAGFDDQLSTNQKAVARTVLLSHRTIPTSFTLAKAPCDHALDQLRRFSQEHRMLAGLGELIVAILGRLATDLPEMYTRTTGATRGDPHDPNVGVTIDVGKGLFIPVVKRARSKDLRAICGELLEYRRRAYHHTFKVDDLANADISISLNLGEGIVFAQPFVYPGQTCMLSLGGVQEEHGPTRITRIVHLGLAYDHRVTNGQQAARFLKPIRNNLQSCESIVGGS